MPDPTTRAQQLLEGITGAPVLTRISMEKLAERPLLSPRTHFPAGDLHQPCAERGRENVVVEANWPAAPWVQAKGDARGRRAPQAIAHRGYKARYPENTMAAFEGAVRAGAHALETDIHLTRDDVVVLSHDATLKRCFGRPEKIVDVDWRFIAPLETLSEPKQHMPRLADLLRYLAQPGLEDLWVLLDIKLDNDPDDVMCLIAATLQSVAPARRRAWRDRVVLGIWATKYLPLCDEHLPGYPVCYIGYSTAYARLFFAVPNVSFNMLQTLLMGPVGAAFIRKARLLNRAVFAWTVNEEKKMRWCIRKQLDGVVTDDPKKFLEVCDAYVADGGAKESFSVKELAQILRVHFFYLILTTLFRLKYGYRLEQRFVVPPRKIVELDE